VTIDEQLRHSQKYSVITLLDDLQVESLSRRKSRPCLKYLKEAEHEGLLHLVTITAPSRWWNNYTLLFSWNATVTPVTHQRDSMRGSQFGANSRGTRPITQELRFSEFP
jgi:hypothetical protein